ncbi:MAG: glycerophosphodiester phosphodiesterase family protein [Pseudomonadota bacterium]
MPRPDTPSGDRTKTSAGHRIELHGHRGARAAMPENTLPGVRAAMEAAVDFVEIDVVLSADGIAHVHHDTCLNPSLTRRNAIWLTASDSALNTLTADQIAAFDVGASRPGSPERAAFPRQKSVPGTPIPTLHDVITCVGEARCTAGRSVGLNIELKSSPIDPAAPDPVALANAVAQALKGHDTRAPIRIQSFDWRALAAMRRCSHATDLGVELGVLTCANPAFSTVTPDSAWRADYWPQGIELFAALADIGATIWGPDHHDLTPADVAAAQTAGMLVSTWTINTAADLDRALRCGVNAVTTDDPAWAARELRHRYG